VTCTEDLLQTAIAWSLDRDRGGGERKIGASLLSLNEVQELQRGQHQAVHLSSEGILSQEPAPAPRLHTDVTGVQQNRFVVKFAISAAEMRFKLLESRCNFALPQKLAEPIDEPGELRHRELARQSPQTSESSFEEDGKQEIGGRAGRDELEQGVVGRIPEEQHT
jgi:hypothetical protein